MRSRCASEGAQVRDSGSGLSCLVSLCPRTLRTGAPSAVGPCTHTRNVGSEMVCRGSGGVCGCSALEACVPRQGPGQDPEVPPSPVCESEPGPAWRQLAHARVRGSPYHFSFSGQGSAPAGRQSGQGAWPLQRQPGLPSYLCLEQVCSASWGLGLTTCEVDIPPCTSRVREELNEDGSEVLGGLRLDTGSIWEFRCSVPPTPTGQHSSSPSDAPACHSCKCYGEPPCFSPNHPSPQVFA